jgi:hypothetical protein
MLQIKAPALSQFTREPISLQVVPSPGNTTNEVEIEDNRANGMETFKMQELDGLMNHASEIVVLQADADKLKLVLLVPYLDSLKTVRPESSLG